MPTAFQRFCTVCPDFILCLSVLPEHIFRGGLQDIVSICHVRLNVDIQKENCHSYRLSQVLVAVAAIFHSLQMSTEKDFCTFSSWVHNLAFKLGSVRSEFYFLLLLVFMVDSIMIINISLAFIIKDYIL